MLSGVMKEAEIEPDLGTGWRQRRFLTEATFPTSSASHFSVGARGFFSPALSLMFKRFCLPTCIY